MSTGTPPASHWIRFEMRVDVARKMTRKQFYECKSWLRHARRMVAASIAARRQAVEGEFVE